MQPTRQIMLVATGASATGLNLALRLTAGERVLLAEGRITLSELKVPGYAPDFVTLTPDANDRVDALLALFYELSPAERLVVGRAVIGTDRWRYRVPTAVA